MGLHWNRPRLLPVTIGVMASLLLLKSVGLVQAATTGQAAADTGSSASPPGAAASGGAGGASLGGGEAAGGAGGAALPPAAAPSPAPPVVSDGERSLLLDLRQRRAALDARAKGLDAREAVMAAEQAKLSAKLDQMTQLQGRLEALESARQQHQAENWAGLVKVYETMKPRDAAAIFDSLDMQVLLAVLDRMQERKLAPILAAMQPDRARLATQMLAEMRLRATSLPAAPSKG